MNSLIVTNIEEAARILNNGGVIGLPTETVYGLGARADYEHSVARIFDIKGRPRNHPLIAHLAPHVDPSRYGIINDHAAQLIDAFWPGPITILVPKTTEIGLWVTGGRDTVALRVPSHPVAQDLLEQVSAPVVAPSANRFGKVSPTTAQHVVDDVGPLVDCVLDGGPCSIGVESTIVECIGEQVSVLRPGGVSAEQISQLLGLALQLPNGESRAPGMLISHYAPDAHVLIVNSFDEADSYVRTNALQPHEYSVLHFDDVEEYALKMYDHLRRCDTDGVSVVLAIAPRPTGIGAAVLDRLRKAAAPKS